MTDGRLTRQVTEVIQQGDGDARLTRQATEVIYRGNSANARFTRQVVEVVHNQSSSANAEAVLTQQVVEIVHHANQIISPLGFSTEVVGEPVVTDGGVIWVSNEGIPSAEVVPEPYIFSISTSGTPLYIFANVGVWFDPINATPQYAYANIGISNRILPPLHIPKKMWSAVPLDRNKQMFKDAGEKGKFVARFLEVLGRAISHSEIANYGEMEHYSEEITSNPFSPTLPSLHLPEKYSQGFNIDRIAREVAAEFPNIPNDIKRDITHRIRRLMQHETLLKERWNKGIEDWGANNLNRAGDIPRPVLTYLTRQTPLIPLLFAKHPELIPGLRRWRELAGTWERRNLDTAYKWSKGKVERDERAYTATATGYMNVTT